MIRDFEDSPAMRTIRDLEDTPTMRMIRDLEDDPTMRMIRGLEDNPTMRMIRGLEDNPTMRTIRDLEDDPTMRMIRGLEDNPTIRMIRDLEDNPTIRMIRDLEDDPTMRMIRGLEDNPTMRMIRDLEDSPAMRLAQSLEGTFPQQMAHLFGAPDRSVNKIASCDPQVLEEVLDSVLSKDNLGSVLEEDVKSELSTLKHPDFDYSTLSTTGKWLALFIFVEVIMPIYLHFYLIPAIEDMKRNVEPNLVETATIQEVRKKARCLDYQSKALLSNCRFITGNGLRLRTGPSQKAEVITLLARGKIVDVIDSSNRSWLEVEVLVDGEYLKGWVARRYTSTFKR